MPIQAETLPSYQEQYEALFGWVRSAFPNGVSICDIGGGGHFLDFPSRLRPMAGRMVGVDPDPGVLVRPWYDDAHQALVEQWAPTTTERFEIVMAVYVVEHVDHPLDFLRAARSLLRPSGSLFGITPNLWHYFGLVSALSMRLGFEDWLLHRVRDRALIEAYHFPVQYRLNSLRRLTNEATRAGFSRSTFRCIEDPGMFSTYFPEALRSIPRRYSMLINRLGRPALFGTILFRLDA